MMPSTIAASARSISPASRRIGCLDDSDTVLCSLELLTRSARGYGGFGLVDQVLPDGLLPLGVDVLGGILERPLFGFGQRPHLDPVRLDLVDQAGVLGCQALPRHRDLLDG